VLSRYNITRVLIFFSCVSVIYKLPALNYSHCLVDTKYFGIDIAHFIVVVKRVKACFSAEHALVRDFGYAASYSVRLRVLVGISLQGWGRLVSSASWPEPGAENACKYCNNAKT
jgi:hypothetical protein